MRSRVAAVAALALVLLTACGTLPAGVDGDLTGSWSAVPAPAAVVPKAGECHLRDSSDQAYTFPPDTVSCDEPHVQETTYVGQFTGAAAALPAPPAPSETPAAGVAAADEAAFQECDRGTVAYLGHSYYSPQNYVRLLVPSDAAWRGGARWFRCDLVTIGWSNGNLTSITKSYREVWSTGSPCAQYANGDFTAYVSCTSPHNTEFVGAFTFPNRPKPTTDGEWDYFHTRCRKLIATYLGVSTSWAVRLGDVAEPMYKSTYWPSGMRVMRCYVWFGKNTMSTSAKGRGTKVAGWR